MKKIILFTVLSAMFSTAFISCKKDAATTPPPPPPKAVESGTVAQLIAAKPLVTTNSRAFSERGITFKSSVKGNIKFLKLNLPGAGSKLVTLWKVSDSSIVESKTVTCTHINSWDDSTAVNIPIEANTAYILSTNDDSFYRVTLLKGTFPFVRGSISLLNFATRQGPAPTFPVSSGSFIISGFADFTFQPAS